MTPVKSALRHGWVREVLLPQRAQQLGKDEPVGFWMMSSEVTRRGGRSGDKARAPPILQSTYSPKRNLRPAGCVEAIDADRRYSGSIRFATLHRARSHASGA